MASEEEFVGGKTPAEQDDDLSLSSEGGTEYDNVSYGSDVQPAYIPQGFVMVLDDSCRARYRPVKAPKDSPFYVCLNKSTCRSLHGGQHPVLRTEHREKPGMYKGIYGVKGQLLAAESGTLTDPDRVEKNLDDQRASDRDQGSKLKYPTPEDSGSASVFSVSEAERIIAVYVNQEGVTEK